MAKSWADGKIVSNGYACDSSRSKIQKELLKDIEEICGMELPTKILRLSNGKYLFPDVFVHDIGLVVEMFGNYWHANPIWYKSNDVVHHGITAQEIWDNDEMRLRKFELVVNEDGDNVCSDISMVVWEKDYRDDRDAVLRKLDAFINWEGCAF